MTRLGDKKPLSLPVSTLQTGEAFTINDFKGKVVLVDTLVQYCPDCNK